MHCVNEWVQLEPVSAALEHFWAHSFRWISCEIQRKLWLSWTLLRFEPLLSAYQLCPIWYIDICGCIFSFSL